MRTCVTPQGDFLYLVHTPAFHVKNMRASMRTATLGVLDGEPLHNTANFPNHDITVEGADTIYEIRNPFPFKGTTFINSRWADARAREPLTIALPEPPTTSFSSSVAPFLRNNGHELDALFSALPQSVLLALATTSTDPADLQRLARLSCRFTDDASGSPSGLLYERTTCGTIRACIDNHDLFEAVANNPHLPDAYKQAMVLRPGAQGNSEIVGEWPNEEHQIFEYLRRNSYIPWGHYASNMANGSVRYHISHLSRQEMAGLRHLYYQRTYCRVAEQIGVPLPNARRTLTADELEGLRREINHALQRSTGSPFFDCTLWGWNYGFDFAPSGYRLNASHQQIHQQFALLPASLPLMRAGQSTAETSPSYACGDLISDCVRSYRKLHDRSLFDDLIACIRNNKRIDQTAGPDSLIIYEDRHVMLFVPKAQTSQWELQLMTLGPVGNILEADLQVRSSLDTAMHLAMHVLGRLGVRMVTTIEYAKRFQEKCDQRLLYAFSPKLPESPGAFSEAQLRWIMGHYPEDFAASCRNKLNELFQ